MNYGLMKSESVELSFNEPDLWVTLARHYNLEAVENGWPEVSVTGSDEISRVSCTIAGFYESSRGKFSEDAIFMPKDQIIIDVKSYLSMLVEGAP